MTQGRRDRRVRRAHLALDGAIVIAGVGFSVALLTHLSLAKAAVFIAVTAFVILQREMPK